MGLDAEKFRPRRNCHLSGPFEIAFAHDDLFDRCLPPLASHHVLPDDLVALERQAW